MATEQETIDLSGSRPDKFTTNILCGRCGEDSTLIYSSGIQGWIMEHENLETDIDHNFYPEI